MKAQFDALSERERQVIGLAAVGYVDKQISEELGVSIHTLRTYWDRIRTKLGGMSRPALVAAYVSEQIAARELSFFDTLRLKGWVMDAQTWQVRATDEINEFHGLRPGIAHHAQEYSRAVHPADSDEFLKQLDLVRSGELPSVHVVYRNVVPGGTETVHATIVGVRDETGSVAKVYGMRTLPHDCRPVPAPELAFGRYERRRGENDYVIDAGMAKLIGHPDKRTLTEAEFFAMIPGATEPSETTLRFRNFEGRLLWAKVWRHEIKRQGWTDVYGYVVVSS